LTVIERMFVIARNAVTKQPRGTRKAERRGFTCATGLPRGSYRVSGNTGVQAITRRRPNSLVELGGRRLAHLAQVEGNLYRGDADGFRRQRRVRGDEDNARVLGLLHHGHDRRAEVRIVDDDVHLLAIKLPKLASTSAMSPLGLLV